MKPIILISCSFLLTVSSALAQAIPDFRVIRRTITKEMAVEPAPLPGMMPVRKERTITVELVEDPHLPAPVQAPPRADETAAGQETPDLEAAREDQHESQLVFISATVYDHRHTLLHWTTTGRPHEEMEAWSNLDFNQFIGLDTVTFNGRTFGLMLAVGNESTAAETSDSASGMPQVPALPAGAPSFVLTVGDPNDAEATAVITGLHELYRTDAARLKAASEARETARREHEAHLRAHPPEPPDILLRIWEIKAEPQPPKQPR